MTYYQSSFFLLCGLLVLFHAWFQRLKPKYDKLVSNFAFNFNLCCYTKAAEAGLPIAQFNLACMLDRGEGVAAPDYPAAAGWYKQGLADNGYFSPRHPTRFEPSSRALNSTL